MEDEEDKEAEKRAPLLQQTEFDYLRRFCEDESRNDGYFPFIMIDRVMKNQSFLENFFREHNNQLWKLKILRHARESKSGAKCTVESKRRKPEQQQQQQQQKRFDSFTHPNHLSIPFSSSWHHGPLPLHQS